MERRKKGIVLILIAILIFGVFAGVEFFGKKEKKEPAQTSATAAIPSATPIPTSVVTITPKPPADAETEEDKKSTDNGFDCICCVICCWMWKRCSEK